MVSRKKRKAQRKAKKKAQIPTTETQPVIPIVEDRKEISVQLEDRVSSPTDFTYSPISSHYSGGMFGQTVPDEKGKKKNNLIRGLGYFGATVCCAAVVGLVGLFVYSAVTGIPKDGERKETPIILSTVQLDDENISCIYSLKNRNNMYIQAQLEADSGKRAWISYPWCGGAVQEDDSTLVGYTHPAGDIDLEGAKKILEACIEESPLPLPKYRSCPKP